MRSQIRGREEGLFAIIGWWFIESRYNIPNKDESWAQSLRKEDIDKKKHSWSEVNYLGSFWRGAST